MISKWRLFNFKSIRLDTEVAFSPLTLFAGSNSSGKSTIIQGLLLFSQTLSSKVESRSVVLNGGLVRLGAFDDLKSFKSDAPQILVGCEIEPQDGAAQSTDIRRAGLSLRRVTCEVSFDASADSPQSELLQLQPRLFGCRIWTSFHSPEDLGDDNALFEIKRATTTPQERVRALELSDDVDEVALNSLQYTTHLSSRSSNEPPVGCVTRHFLPAQLTRRHDEAQRRAEVVSRALAISRVDASEYEAQPIPPAVIELLNRHLEQERDLLTAVDPGRAALFEQPERALITLREWRQRVAALPPSRQASVRHTVATLADQVQQLLVDEGPRGHSLTVEPVPSPLCEAVSYLDSFFSTGVKYLGPLRDEPKALYPLATSVDPRDVGLRGEYTAAVLDLHKDVKISYIPTSRFAKPAIEKLPVVRSLQAAVLDWLKYMGVVEDLVTRDRGKLGHELKVTTAGIDTPHDLTHVGVGVSQVLPIVVMCLLAPKDTTLIFEQPELHLHPRVQTLLGDFFLSVSLMGKQCVVETHSEYLVNRLRLRVAAASGDALTPYVRLYFVSKKDGSSEYRPVVVNQYGAITDWPEGFFDQSQREAEEILKAAILKKKQERKGEGRG